jgi:hypothetical protein
MILQDGSGGMEDGDGSGGLTALLERLLAGVAVIRDENGTPGIGIGEGVADLIDAQPVLLSPAADAELARLLASNSDPSVQDRIKAARQVLTVCRDANGTVPLRGSGEDNPGEDDASDKNDPTRSLLAILQALSQAERPRSRGSRLRRAFRRSNGLR